MSLFFRVLLTLAAVVPAAADVTDRVSRTAPLAPGTPVTVHATIGRLQVSGWERPDVSVEIERRAPDANGLARISAQIDTAGPGVSIRVVQPEGAHDAALRSDIVVRVPRAANVSTLSLFEGRMELDGLAGTVSAHVERGDVLARNIGGAIRVETGMGDIRLERATLSPDGLMRLRTFNGNVTLELDERPANARVLALSMGGTITSDLPLTRQERWGPRWAETTIGTGEPLISIDVVNGDIALKVAK